MLFDPLKLRDTTLPNRIVLGPMQMYMSKDGFANDWHCTHLNTYARGGFESRLIYSGQSESVSLYEVHDLNTVVPEYSTLDLRMSYNFNAPRGPITLFLEGDDLLRDASEPDIRNTTANTPGRSDAEFSFPNTYQYSGGRTITVGVRARF